MPRVKSHTPSWLSRPSPGFEMFSQASTKPLPRDTLDPTGPSRTIARRGTQLFVAVGSEVRWTDLVFLKDFSEEQERRSRRPTPLSVDSGPESLWRPLRVTVPGKITQLSVSPHGDFLAIVTSHTIHIVVLHASYELDTIPARMKSFQLGPTQHVFERSPIVSVLWHPLSPAGRCLVTLTSDAVLRLWEMDKQSKHSFEESELSIDLGKLANLEEEQVDLRASQFGQGLSYMQGKAYLEPAAACFGGFGRSGEHPWSAMTYWIATVEGDVYALSPLVPTKFRAYPGLVQNLRDLRDAKDLNNEDIGAVETQIHQAEMQDAWIRNLDRQDTVRHSTPSQHEIDVLTRPKEPRPEPALQAFALDVDVYDIADIVVRNISLGEEPLEFETGELLEDDDDDVIPLGMSVICLLTRSGYVHTLLDLDGVEGQWPATRDLSVDEDENTQSTEDRSLVLVETTQLTMQDDNNLYPSFTPDPTSAYAFYITTAKGISHLSLESWVEQLRDELEDPKGAGEAFRVGVFLESMKSTLERIIPFDDKVSGSASNKDVPACVTFYSQEPLDYIILTSFHGHPTAATIDTKHRDLQSSSLSASRYPTETPLLLPPATRESYQSDRRFYDPSPIPAFIKSLPNSSRIPFNSDIPLTPDALNLLITTHQSFSAESQALSAASARTFRATNRMLSEFEDQLTKLRETKSRIDSISGTDEELPPIETNVGTKRLQQRLADAQARQAQLTAKARAVAKKLGTVSGRQVSEKQRDFVKEINTVESEAETLQARFDAVKKLAGTIAKVSGKGVEKKEEPERTKVPSSFRRAKMAQIGELLERETFMVDATTERLSRLSVQL